MRKHLWKVSLGALGLLAALIFPAQAGNPNCKEVDGDYIVSFPKSANVGNEMKAAAGKQITTKFDYNTALNGFAATLTAEQACAFKKRPGAIVERDVEVFAKPRSGSTTTTNWYSWGLNRIDEKTLPLNDAADSTNSTFSRGTDDGSGVKAYIIDTGIYSSHSQFQGRVVKGFTAINDGRGTEDCNGHGTHVAGTVGGLNTGVANKVTLVAVRVLNCQGSGTWSGVIAGINYIISNKSGASVANMSLGGGYSESVNLAIKNLVGAGVVTVVAAGNDGADACNYSPAGEPLAITVGATDNPTSDTEGIASYSNTGKCVDIYAPGTNIKSTWIGNTNASNTISGTSMASPHVTGIIARYLKVYPNSTPAEALSALNAKKNPLGSTNVYIACLINECTKS